MATEGSELRELSPDSSTTQNTVLKRKSRKRVFSEEFERDSNGSEESNESQGVDRSEESSGSNGSQGSNGSEESTRSDTAIPNETNYWNAGVLDLIRISIQRDQLYKPMTIVDILLKNLPLVVSKRVASIESIKKRVGLIMECLNEFKPFQRLDFENIVQIRDKEDSNYQLFTRKSNGCSEWTVKIPPNPIKSEDHWYHMFISYADVFAEDLKFMISRYQHDKKIPEAMYVALFKDFIGMFGVHGVATPCVPKQTITIGEVEVSSIPDMLLMDQLNIVKDTPGAFSIDILTLIETKKVFKEPDNSSPPSLRSKYKKYETNSSDRKVVLKVDKEFSVGENLLGQHVGELLVHCPFSSCKNHGIMGMIVEDTHVTFSYLFCNEEQLETIKIGKCNPYDYRPAAIFSKSYNFLKNSDRKELIEPLLTLGLLQRI